MCIVKELHVLNDVSVLPWTFLIELLQFQAFCMKAIRRVCRWSDNVWSSGAISCFSDDSDYKICCTESFVIWWVFLKKSVFMSLVINWSVWLTLHLLLNFFHVHLLWIYMHDCILCIDKNYHSVGNITRR